MTLAIHISSRDDIYGHLLKSFLYAAAAHPNDHFIFVSDGPLKKNIPFLENCTPVETGPEIKNALLRYYWYNYKIPSILTRYQADVLFTPREVCSLNTAVPQVMLLSRLIKTRGGRLEQLRRKYSEKAFRIGTFEKEIYFKAVKAFPAQKLFHAGHGLMDLSQVGENKEDSPYFASVITNNNTQELIQLLKAFSLFKKWQRSSYKLVLIFKDNVTKDAIPNFSTYKYRDDVTRIETREAKPMIDALANAYSVIQLFNSADGMNLELEAMRHGIPVISTCPNPEQENFFGSSALYAANNEAGIAEQMMRFYKDENMYREYAQKAREFSAGFNWQATVQTLYGIAAEAVGQRL